MKYKQIINKINNLLNKNKINKEENLTNNPEIIEQKINRNKFGFPIYTDKNNKNIKQ
jgi:uncharacterized protein YnzC (UPF0291/DUF896 family)